METNSLVSNRDTKYVTGLVVASEIQRHREIQKVAVPVGSVGEDRHHQLLELIS